MLVARHPVHAAGHPRRSARKRGRRRRHHRSTADAMPRTRRGRAVAPADAPRAGLLEASRLAQVLRGRAGARQRRRSIVRDGEVLGLLGPERLGQVDADQRRQRPLPARRGAHRLFAGAMLAGTPRIGSRAPASPAPIQIPRPFAQHDGARQRRAARRCSAARRLDRGAAERRGAALARVHARLPARPTRSPTSSTCTSGSSSSSPARSRSRPRLVLLDEVLSGLTPDRDRRRGRARCATSATRARRSSWSST